MNAHTKARLANVIAVLVALICILQAMRWSYQDAQREQTTYCQMVQQHIWPDYKHDYARVCK